MQIRLFPIIHKEFLHILRDPRSLAIIVVMPILMVLLYGYAITFDVKDIKLGVIDHDKTPASRELVNRFVNSGYFTITAHPKNRDEVEHLMLNREVLSVLVIPRGFAHDLKRETYIPIQLLVDGSNSNTATIAINYARMIMMTYSIELNAQIVRPLAEVHERVWYNPDLKSVTFIAPGLIAVILMMICALLTSITIARERETGTMEQLLVSPIRSPEIIVGKVVPYVLLAFIDGTLVVVFAILIFGVPFRGNVALLALLSFFYLYASLSLGVFVSTRAKTQQVAMMLAMLGTLLPSILLSGFIFPIQSMPYILRVLSYTVPARYFLTIIRGIMLKGIGFEYLWVPTLFLFGFGTLLLVISSARFKTKLE
jgi:ABC-2 type transport system permease protein